MRASLLVTLLLVGCAADGVEAPRQDGTDAHRRLAQVRAAHTEAIKQLTEAPAAHQEACRATSGDCLLQVAETRGRLVSSFRLDPCESSDTPETKSSCVTAQLEHGGHERELADYYGLESWCFKQLAQCTAAKAEEARSAALDSRFVSRRQDLERAPAAVTARSGAALARARIEYLRATLPPSVDVCASAATFQACQRRVEAERSAFEETLRQDDYDAASAVPRYVALAQDEASCSQPEVECLSSALASYGVFPEARKYVERNLALLAERQTLLGQVSNEAGQHCLSSSQKQRQPEIVSAYVAYAREQVLYFRMQLDKSFLQLHQDEVTCLRAGRKTAPAVQQAVAER